MISDNKALGKLILESIAKKEKEEEMKKKRAKTKEDIAKNEALEITDLQYKPIVEAKTYIEFKQKVADTLVTEALTCLANSSMDSILASKDYNKNLMRGIVSNFVNENGSLNLIRSFRTKSYMLSEMALIIESSMEAIFEKANPKDQSSLKINEKEKNKFYKDLDNMSAENVVTAIKTKVKNATQEFIDSNNKAKEDIKQILNKTKNQIKNDDGKDDNLKEAYSLNAKAKIFNVRNSKTKNVFEAMVYNLSESALHSEEARSIYVENASLNVDKIVEHCEVMYTFLETMNTCNIINVDEQFIENMLKDMKI